MTDHTPARSCMASTTLSKETSAAIIATCRRNKVTFGNAFPVCAQVAFARVLHRQYARGEISAERWEQIRREPHHVCGPLNVRPFLDSDWFLKGGGGEVCLSIGFFYHTLPYVPLGDCDSADMKNGQGLPTFANLLSSGRFFLRSNIIKSQSAALLQDPLFLDINAIRIPTRRDQKRNVLRQWREAQSGRVGPAMASRDVSYLSPAVVFAHGGSSMGNVSVPSISCGSC